MVVSILSKIISNENLSDEEITLVGKKDVVHSGIEWFHTIKTEYEKCNDDCRPLSEQEQKTLKEVASTDELKNVLEHFDIKTYRRINILIRYASLLEDSQSDKDADAMKLTLLFGNIENILKYLTDFSKKNNTAPKVIHDACLLSLPSWDIQVEFWRKIIIKNIMNPTFKKILPFIHKLEKYAKDGKKQQELLTRVIEKISLRFNKEFEREYEEEINISFDKFMAKCIDESKIKKEAKWRLKQQLIIKVFGTLKKLSRDEEKIIAEHMRKLQEDEVRKEEALVLAEFKKKSEEKYKSLASLRNKSKAEFVNDKLKSSEKIITKEAKRQLECLLSIPDKPDNFSVEDMFSLVKIAGLDRYQEDPLAAEYYIAAGVPEKVFIEYLDLKKKGFLKSGKDFERVIIDGKDFGYAGYYITLLEPEDFRAPILGFLTNCCQHLAGAGRSSTLYGLTHSNSGFFVLCKGDAHHPKMTDEIRAQTWAWYGEEDILLPPRKLLEKLDKKEKTELVMVFDSIESPVTMRNNPENRALMNKAFLYLAYHLVNRGFSSRIHLGVQGNTPKEFLPYPSLLASMVPKISRVPKAYHPITLRNNFYLEDESMRSKIIFTDSEFQKVIVDKDNLGYTYAVLGLLKDLEEFFKMYPDVKTDEFYINFAIEQNNMPLFQLILRTLEEDEIKIISEARLTRIKMKKDPLALAIQKNRLEMVQCLLSFKVFRENIHHYIGIAILCNNQEAVDLLLKSSPDIKYKNSRGENFLDIAIREKSLPLIEKFQALGLISTSPIAPPLPVCLPACGDSKSKQEKESLKSDDGKESKESKDSKEFILEPPKPPVLDKKPDVLCFSDDKVKMQKKLIKEIMAGTHKNVESILTENTFIDVNFTIKKNETPLMIAAELGDKAIVSCLIKHGANVLARDANGDTALMRAADHGNTAVLKQLIDINPKHEHLDLQDHDGDTALLRAVYSGHLDCMDLLIKCGANIDIKNNKGFNLKNLPLEEIDEEENCSSVDRKILIDTIMQMRHADSVGCSKP